MNSFLRNIRHKTIAKRFDLSNKTSILDTSCQDGSFLQTLSSFYPNQKYELSGIDIDKKVILQAQKLLPEGNFITADNTQIPFSDKIFDCAISSLTLHHMSDPVSSLREMHRVLKSTGVLYLTDIMAENRVFNYFLKRMKCPEPYHFEKFYSLNEVYELLWRTGFVILKKEKFLVYPLCIPLTTLVLGKE